MTRFVCEGEATVEQLTTLFQGKDGLLMRASINIRIKWNGWVESVLWHAAGTAGVGSEVVRVLLDEGGAQVDGLGWFAQTPLMLVALRDNEEDGVEVARGEFVLLSWIHIVLTHGLFCV